MSTRRAILRVITHVLRRRESHQYRARPLLCGEARDLQRVATQYLTKEGVYILRYPAPAAPRPLLPPRNDFHEDALPRFPRGAFRCRFADIAPNEKPEPDPAAAASFPDYRTETLPNGLRIFVIEDDRKPHGHLPDHSPKRVGGRWGQDRHREFCREFAQSRHGERDAATFVRRDGFDRSQGRSIRWSGCDPRSAPAG